MPLVIPIAHDFTCGWCWIGFHQATQLREEFGVELEWLGFEQHPEGEPWPDPLPSPTLLDRPRIPTRFELALAAQGMSKPGPVPKRVYTHHAHEAVELAKTKGGADKAVGTIYRAFWERGVDIGDSDALVSILDGLLATEDLRYALEARRFAASITPFDAGAHAKGVFNIPTFWIGEARYAEQPLGVLRRALEALR